METNITHTPYRLCFQCFFASVKSMITEAVFREYLSVMELKTNGRTSALFDNRLGVFPDGNSGA